MTCSFQEFERYKAFRFRILDDIINFSCICFSSSHSERVFRFLGAHTPETRKDFNFFWQAANFSFNSFIDFIFLRVSCCRTEILH